jgi:hypothetical protein
MSPGPSLHMRGRVGGGGRGRGVSEWHRSIALVLAFVLGYIDPNIAGGALDAVVGYGSKWCLAFTAADGLGLDEPDPGVSRPVAGGGSLGPQLSPRAGSKAHEAGHVSASVQSGAARQGKKWGGRRSTASEVSWLNLHLLISVPSKISGTYGENSSLARAGSLPLAWIGSRPRYSRAT